MVNMLIIMVFLFSGVAFGQDAATYLILNDIGTYKLTPGFEFMGKTVGRAPSTFQAGDNASGYYTAYKISYEGSSGNPHPTVEIRVCADSQWLLHDVDTVFRDKYGIPTVSYYPWQIDGQTILIDAVDGREYRWLSGNVVIIIEYHGSLTQMPEPKEIVKAYLAKYPSTIPAMTLSQLRSSENKTKWIKDEMDRRLWLGDKWFTQIQTSDPKIGSKLKSMTDSMAVFLSYREKYFGIEAKDELIVIETTLSQKNVTAIQAKLAEYKAWWSVHKGDSITLP